MNNWAYARQLPPTDWHGAASVVRDIRLESGSGRPVLASSPTAALTSLEGEPAQVPGGGLGDGRALPVPDSGAFKADVELERPASGSGEARLLLQSGGTTYATVGYDFASGRAFVVRDGDAVAGGKDRPAGSAVDDAYRAARSVEARPAGDIVRLTVFVDRSSVEVFVAGQTLTSLVFPPAGHREARLAGDGGVQLKGGTVTPLAGIR
jgi:levanbiose-producing levanase